MNAEMNVKDKAWSATIHQAYQRGTMQITFCTIKRLKQS